jgi:molybdate transport system substrate-binding protein
MVSLRRIALQCVIVLTTVQLAAANAAEIKALLPLSLNYAAMEVVPSFVQATGHKVMVAYGTAGAVAGKVRNGDAADVLVSSAAQIDDLQKTGKIAAGTIGVAKVGVGALVRKGAPRPDMSSVESFKAAVLAAKAISYTDPALGGPAGIYMAKLFDQLGVAEQVRPKTKLSGPGDAVSTTVVNGEAEIGFIMINEIIADPRVDFVGPLPQPIQDYTSFKAGLVAGSVQPQAGRALIEALSSPGALSVMTRLGFERF